jgi:hypothetical protein
MKYTRNGVYTYVCEWIQESYPETDFTSRYVPKPSTFPNCYIHEIDRSRPLEYTQLDFKDVQYESVFEIQVSSNKKNSAASEAYAIMELAKEAFNSLYYREFSETTVDYTDRFTVIGRFRRIIGGGDQMPKKSK